MRKPQFFHKIPVFDYLPGLSDGPLPVHKLYGPLNGPKIQGKRTKSLTMDCGFKYLFRKL